MAANEISACSRGDKGQSNSEAGSGHLMQAATSGGNAYHEDPQWHCVGIGVLPPLARSSEKTDPYTGITTAELLERYVLPSTQLQPQTLPLSSSPASWPNSMQKLPSAVLLHLASSFLSDADACRFSQTSLYLQSCLQSRYVLKEEISASRWKEPVIASRTSSISAATVASTPPSAASVSLAFGRPRILLVNRKEDFTLLPRLNEIAPSASHLVLRCNSTSSHLPEASTWRLPANLKNCVILSDQVSGAAQILLPLELETLDLSGVCKYVVTKKLYLEGKLSQFPATLRHLRMPPGRCQDIDMRFFALPPNLQELHNWCWSLDFLEIPSTLTFLSYDHDGKAGVSTSSTTHSALDWSTCPHLTDLNLQDKFCAYSLSSLRLPANLRRARFTNRCRLDAS